jgi:hypothetical protein
MGAEIISINDGSGWKIRFSKTYSQWVRTGGAPLFTIEVRCPRDFTIFTSECKRRLHGKSHFEILAQEVGELFAVLRLRVATNPPSQEGSHQVHFVDLMLLISFFRHI